MKHRVTYLLVIAVTVAGTAAHGFVTGRWLPQGPASELVLPPVPTALGDWSGEDVKSALADDPVLKNLTRKYTHARTGRVFTVSLTLGPAGLIAQHTPEYCYPGSGYQTVGATQAFTLAEGA